LTLIYCRHARLISPMPRHYFAALSPLCRFGFHITHFSFSMPLITFIAISHYIIITDDTFHAIFRRCCQPAAATVSLAA